MTVVHLPTRTMPGRLLSKKELARELGRSPRWVELRMREGMPVKDRKTDHQPAEFDLQRVRAWLDAKAQRPKLSLEERVARLEAEIANLRRTG